MNHLQRLRQEIRRLIAALQGLEQDLLSAEAKKMGIPIVTPPRPQKPHPYLGACGGMPEDEL